MTEISDGTEAGQRIARGGAFRFAVHGVGTLISLV